MRGALNAVFSYSKEKVKKGFVTHSSGNHAQAVALSSKIANKIRSIILNDDCIDTGSSLKVFHKNIFLSFPFFDGLHRFLPAIFISECNFSVGPVK